MRLRKLFILSVASLLLMGFTFSSPTDSKVIKPKIYFSQLDKSVKKEIECLIDNIHYEAAGESHTGKIAVAFVTMNRVNSGKYPSRVCDVIYQRDSRVCQFSWVCQNKTTVKNVLTLSHEMYYNYIRDLAISVYFYHDQMQDPTKGAIFYHADYVSPNWKKVKKTVTIGRHIFYKSKNDMRDI